MNSTSDHQKQQFLNSSALEVVVELQKAELDRLLAENKRLHQRIDQLLQLQEREQVLRGCVRLGGGWVANFAPRCDFIPHFYLFVYLFALFMICHFLSLDSTIERQITAVDITITGS